MKKVDGEYLHVFPLLFQEPADFVWDGKLVLQLEKCSIWVDPLQGGSLTSSKSNKVV